ncbi:winged helix-turn-helix domain-containing protein [Pelagibacteraceae bacterium]|jgi:DNA-binding CsgD family transcriptional regulator|nr:winged helix-turn-helix domain-containing protein [Candidatus Pelagibacter bacterium]MDC0627580.1 winged helix-turn-helix domain-containing protein [Candidatus Pelagibacter sp.]MDC1253323.1 winged helix-turn-helix domain-containing protein [Pelagibacteraceae bacterium]
MIKQNLFIINFNSLYEILNEIKDKLSFNIENYVSEDIFLKKSDIDLKNSLIISKSNNKLILEKKLDPKIFFDLSLFPIPIDRLIELINIQLIKLRFNQQSKINIKDYELDINSKFIAKNDLHLKLTEKEIEIILYLSATKTKYDVADLQKNIWGYSTNMETHTVETHIYRLRKKIDDKFNDQSFILSDKSGYFID